MTKLICIIGVTGNQGGSAAARFLLDPTSAAAQKPSAQGVEVVAGNLDDVQTLITVFAGANLIFGVTNYWEVQQGRNIVVRRR